MDQPRVYGYCRASTTKQVESPDVQKGIIRSYVNRTGLPGPAIEFTDPATSGGVPIRERKAGGAMCARLRRGDHVVVSRLDRGFRSLKDFCNTLEQWEAMGVAVHLCDCQIDFNSPIGRMCLQVLAAFAELERKVISTRMKEGFNHTKAAGRKHARFPGYGFQWAKRRLDGKVIHVRVPHPEERQTMRQIAAWRLQCPRVTWPDIEQRLMDMGAKTKDGKDWNTDRIRKACKAEFSLQMGEQGDRR